MCGVLGLLCRRGGRPYMGRLCRMATLMRHRGPDDEGYALFDPQSGKRLILAGPDTPVTVRQSGLPYAPDPGRAPMPALADLADLPDGFRVGLGHRRLSIIDLSPAGHQPLCDPTGRYWIAFNGEIYNYRDVRRELEALGHHFSGGSDTEVALAAYAAWGDACQERFNGMWAMLVWDRLERSLWISRDRFGVKPLFYRDHPDYFAVASEIKSFLPLGPLAPYLPEVRAYLVDGPSECQAETMFDGVRRFPAGNCARISLDDAPGRLAPRPFYALPPANLDTAFSRAALARHAEAYHELLKDAVRLRLHADVKVSCALSGGLDSSSITCLATEVLAELGNANRLVTVSNVYRDPAAAACDESRFVALVAAALPVECLTIEPGPDNILTVDDLALWHYENVHDDVPVSSLATFALCRASGLTVNLDGQGADENLAGYLRYFNDYLAHPPGYGPEFCRTFLKAPIPFRDKVLSALRLRTRAGIPPLARAAGTCLDPDYRRSRQASVTFADQPLNATLRGNILGSLAKLLRNVDCHSMFHSVESRQPYLDYRLIEQLVALPLTYKIRAGWTKYVARVAFVDKLPAPVVWRKDKLGWPQPLGRWLAPLLDGPMRRAIVGSAFLRETLTGLDDGLLAELRPHYRLYTRLYNLARHFAIFHETAPAALVRGADPRNVLAEGTL